MRTILLLPLLALAAPASAATRDWRLAGFDKVDLAAAATVDIHSGGAFAVHADGEQRLVERLNVFVRDGTLVIGWIKGPSIERVHDEHLRVSVTLPRIAAAGVSGAGTVMVDRVEGPSFTGSVGGAGTLKLPQVRAGKVMLGVGGAGSLSAAGTAQTVNATVSGVGSIDAGALAARAGLVTISGTGSIKARVDGPAEVNVSGVGSATVLGNARCVIHKSFLGSVRCGGR